MGPMVRIPGTDTCTDPWMVDFFVVNVYYRVVKGGGFQGEGVP